MIVCDECRDVTKKVSDVSLVIEKTDDPGRKGRKTRPREVIKIPLALCEGCLTLVCKNLGHLKHEGRLSGAAPSRPTPHHGRVHRRLRTGGFMSVAEDRAREVREQLLPYLNRRVEVEGTVSRVGSLYDPQARLTVPSVCVSNLEVREDEHPVIDHCWVGWATLLVKRGVRPGDTLRFTAQVYDYPQKTEADPNRVVRRMGLREPRDVTCLNRALDDPGREEAAQAERREAVPVAAPLPAPAPAPVPPPPAPPPAPADPKRELFDTLWALVERHGLGRVEKTLKAIEVTLED